MRLFRLELERSIRRRMVWVLLAVASVGIVVLGLIAFFDSFDLDLAELARTNQTHPAVVSDWWVAGSGDGTLSITAFFLFMGGLIGGAGVVGGEWKSGSIATMLTWEPRRVRVLGARLAAIGLWSFVLAVFLQLLQLLAFLPSAMLHGSTAGLDAAYALEVFAAVVRIAAITAFAAVLGGCLASISRSTAGAILAVWIWLALVESILRGRKPWLSAYLLTDTAVRVLTWADFGGEPARQSPPVALGLMAAYALLTAGAAIWLFRRADVVAG